MLETDDSIWVSTKKDETFIKKVSSLHLFFAIEQDMIAMMDPVAQGFIDESKKISQLTFELSRHERRDYIRRVFHAKSTLLQVS